MGWGLLMLVFAVSAVSPLFPWWEVEGRGEEERDADM